MRIGTALRSVPGVVEADGPVVLGFEFGFVEVVNRVVGRVVGGLVEADDRVEPPATLRDPAWGSVVSTAMARPPPRPSHRRPGKRSRSRAGRRTAGTEESSQGLRRLSDHGWWRPMWELDCRWSGSTGPVPSVEFEGSGGMAERTIATVLKTVEVQASGGSNPPPSAHSLSGVPDRYARAPTTRACSCGHGEMPESGRSGLPAKEVWAQVHRGFESHSLRQAFRFRTDNQMGCD